MTQQGDHHGDQYFEDEPLDMVNYSGDDDDMMTRHAMSLNATMGKQNAADNNNNNSSGFHFEGVDTAMSKEERRRERRRRRNERTGKIVVCFCCILIIIAIVLAVVLTQEAAHVYRVYVHPIHTGTPTASPTATVKPRVPPPTVPPTPKRPTFTANTLPPIPPPTFAPVPMRTPVPTISPAPTYGVIDTYEYKGTVDTYIFIDGPDVTKAFGREETFLVQYGTKRTTKPNQPVEVPTAYSFLQFGNLHRLQTTVGGDEDGADVVVQPPLPNKERWAATTTSGGDMKVLLELSHIPLAEYVDDANQVEDRNPVVLQAYFLPPNDETVWEGLNLKSLTGTTYNAQKRGNTGGGGILVGSVSVSPSDEVVVLDVTQAFLGVGDHIFDDQDDVVTFFLKVDDGTNAQKPQFVGDRFASRDMPVESDSSTRRGPHLIFTNMV